MDEFKQRFMAAKNHRNEYIDEAGREVYKFCFNGREREWDGKKRNDDEPEEIFADVTATVAEEFFGELFSTMTPENTPWVEYEAGNGVGEEDAADAEKQLGEFEAIIAKSIRSSNYYDEGQTAFQDAVVGNVAMWTERPTLTSPVVCEAVAIPEIHVRLGPRGLEDRFRTQSYFYRDLPSLFPDADWPREIKEKIKKSSNGQAKVCWGFWRNYQDPSNPFWRREIRVDEKPNGLDEDREGDGSIELIIGRYNPVPKSAWGRGPGIRMLPSLRVIDELTRMNLEGMDKNLDPAYTYPHDGILDLSEGIEAGMGYPAMPGSADSIQALLTGNLDYGFFSEERLYEIIRDGFYREVEQRGKTPPSATQFVGQEQKQLRRMARGAAKLWREFGVGILKRFEYLERQPGGMLEGTELPLLDSGTVIARPISPLERAQAREDVLVAQSIMGMAQESLGEQAALVIDGPKTMTNIKTTLKDKIVEFRSEEELLAIMQQLQGGQGEQVDPQEGP